MFRDLNKHDKKAAGSESPTKNKDKGELVSNSIYAQVQDDHFSAHIPGIVGYMRYMQYLNEEPNKCDFNVDHTEKMLQKSLTSKRNDIKRTLIGFQKSDCYGYRLEKRMEFNHPAPQAGNNYYKNHSQISKKNIFRKYKGPLYNEAGRACIELTQKYVPLESFRYTTQLDNMKF